MRATFRNQLARWECYIHAPTRKLDDFSGRHFVKEARSVRKSGREQFCCAQGAEQCNSAYCPPIASRHFASSRFTGLVGGKNRHARRTVQDYDTRGMRIPPGETQRMPRCIVDPNECGGGKCLSGMGGEVILARQTRTFGVSLSFYIPSKRPCQTEHAKLRNTYGTIKAIVRQCRLAPKKKKTAETTVHHACAECRRVSLISDPISYPRCFGLLRHRHLYSEVPTQFELSSTATQDSHTTTNTGTAVGGVKKTYYGNSWVGKEDRSPVLATRAPC